jgi:hypothetical protein
MFATRCPSVPAIAVKTGCVICLLRVLCSLPAASAGHLTDIEVSEQAGSYQVRMVMLVHAPAIFVHRVLTDYAHIYRMNPSITESEILPSPDNETVRVRTRIEGCVFFFCKDIDRVEDVRELNPEHLQAVIVPTQSDFTSGRADWRIHPVGEDSQVVYQAEITPAFFIPPVIGDYFIERTIAREVVTSFAKLECIARIKAGLDTRSRQYLAVATSDARDVDAIQAAMLTGGDPSTQAQATAAGGNAEADAAVCPGTCDLQGSGC